MRPHTSRGLRAGHGLEGLSRIKKGCDRVRSSFDLRAGLVGGGRGGAGLLLAVGCAAPPRPAVGVGAVARAPPAPPSSPTAFLSHLRSWWCNGPALPAPAARGLG